MHSTLRFTLFRALLLLFYATMSTACTEAIINDPCSNAVVSSRTMSFDAELSPRVTAATPGASLRLLEIADNTTSTFGPSVAVRQRFVCISHAPTAFEYYPADDPIRQINNAICIDGLNNAGLSVVVLYQLLPGEDNLHYCI